MITQDLLKELFEYNPDTGDFFRKITVSSNAKAGDVAGSITSTGHKVIFIKNKRYMAHHLAWLYVFGALPSSQIDHIDHDGGNNRIDNLREADQSQNMRNMSKRKDNTSGVTGVYKHKASNKWQVGLRVDGKFRYFGLFEDINAAILTRRVIGFAYGYHNNHGAAQ